MAGKRQSKAAMALRRRGEVWLVRYFSPFLGLLVLLASGCQKSGTTDQAAQAQLSQKQGVTETQPKPAEATESAPPSGNVPKITLKETVHDFGEVGPETKHTAQFTFTNSGKAPLKIIQVKNCCGVLTKGVENGQEFAPGRSGTLEVEYNSGAYPGDVSRNLFLTTNDTEHKVVTLTLKAKIVRRVDYRPERLKLFLRQDNAGSPDITLTGLDGQAFSVTGVKCTANAITVEFDPAVKATEFVLKPKVDMEKIQRNLKGQISIDTSHPECKNIRVLYDVLPEFTINPPQIMLFNLKADQAVQREIWVLSNYQDEFEIESVAAQKGSVKLLDQKKVGNRYQLRIEVTPPAPADERSVLSDVLEVKIKGGDTLSIPFRGFY